MKNRFLTRTILMVTAFLFAGLPFYRLIWPHVTDSTVSHALIGVMALLVLVAIVLIVSTSVGKVRVEQNGAVTKRNEHFRVIERDAKWLTYVGILLIGLPFGLVMANLFFPIEMSLHMPLRVFGWVGIAVSILGCVLIAFRIPIARRFAGVK